MPEQSRHRGRPKRLRLPDFAGRPVTLPDEATSWQHVGAPAPGAPTLILGLGPLGQPPPEIATGEVFWLDTPSMRHLGRPPAAWRRLSREEALALAPAANIFFYMPGLRLDPRFWGALLARIELEKQPFLPARAACAAWLPGHEGQLLRRELEEGLRHCGFGKIISACPRDVEEFRAMCAPGLPSLALSVNFRGLDGEGRIFDLCAALSIPLAIWLVDNPWNLLSAIGLPWWQEALLLVTDASFVEPLQKYGAKHVHFLPLAGNGAMRASPQPAPSGQPLFVGRSAFPEKKGFFAGVKTDPEIWTEALGMLEAESGPLPDFHWWRDKCGQPLWPGKGGRAPALGADECSALRRCQWLRAGLPHGLRIVGDKGWQSLLPGAQILPPVDYYGVLPHMCGNALCCLNVTSLLLPQSLSQRHFDVWLAGGFLLTDATRGLEIFDPGLVAPVTLREPGQFGEKTAWLNARHGERRELIRAWQEEIRARHLYADRIRRIVELVETQAHLQTR